MKTKVRLVKAEKQSPQHQMMFIPTRGYPPQKIWYETEQKEVQNDKWKKMFKTHQKSEPSYFVVTYIRC